jgi:maltose alpha-D-glucosyltransferase/alpha-amylase
LRVEVVALQSLPGHGEPVWLVLAAAHLGEGQAVTVPLLFTLCRGKEAGRVAGEYPGAVAARLTGTPEETLVVNGFAVEAARAALFAAASRARRTAAEPGGLAAIPLSRTRPRLAPGAATRFFRDPRGNMVMVAEGGWSLKTYARVEPGPHPEAELLEYLAAGDMRGYVPAPATALAYAGPGQEPTVLALLTRHVPGAAAAAELVGEGMARALESVLASGPEAVGLPPDRIRLQTDPPRETARLLARHLGHYHLEMLGLLGRRTAMLHLALAAPTADERFSPEPFSLLYQRAVNQSMRNLARRTLAALRARLAGRAVLGGTEAALAREAVAAEPAMLEAFARFAAGKFPLVKTRLHGDMGLSRVLFTGKDFVFADFEGDPDKSVSERRIKRSPLRDVAGMCLSILLAAHATADRLGRQRPEDAPALAPWIEPLALTAAQAFWSAYRETAPRRTPCGPCSTVFCWNMPWPGCPGPWPPAARTTCPWPWRP